ncbi:hypothetical protein N2152v2_010097 [Parachlorella kessleri]
MERVWHPPEGCACTANGDANGSAQPTRLVLYNSYLDRKVPFVPAAGPDSKQIGWYTCGPTVYDSAHVGHARNYVSFDVVRRVLEDYFGYNITFVMNVTDVDDKIILRARRNHLLENYKRQTQDQRQIYDDITAAVQASLDRQHGKVAETEGALAAEEAVAGDKAAERRKEELRTALAQEQLLRSKAEAALGALRAAGPSAGAAALFELGSDALAEALDCKLGATVTDPAIFRAHAAKHEVEFLEDMAALGCRQPDVLTRVSEYMAEVVEYVERIVANGIGYEANGSVYFDTQRFRESGHVYGKLNPWAVGSAALGGGECEGGGGDKRNPSDFALWKAQKPGEPAWDSPWGRGRPGWHIECSAMASAILGSKLDIHTGGEDLRFPHHDNELAQAEAYYHECGCQQWVNYFLHSGHLSIEGLKMSKSLKNFISIRQALETFSPRQLRLLFVLQPWEKRMMYGEQAKEEMRSREMQLRNFFANVDVHVRRAKPGAPHARWDAEEQQLSAEVSIVQRRVHEALCDNINTRAAMDALADLVKAVNVYLAKKDSTPGVTPQPLVLRKAAAYVTRILSAFGLVGGPGDVLGFTSEAAAAASSDHVADVLDALAAFRDRVRGLAKSKADAKEVLSACDSVSDQAVAKLAGDDQRAAAMLAALKDFREAIRSLAAAAAPPAVVLAACDRVRDESLVELGVRLEDKADGSSVWKPEDPAVLRQELAERRQQQQEAALRKLRSALDVKRKELDKFEKLAALPSPQDALADKYSAFDPVSGDPTHEAATGAALEGKALDKARKDMEKQRKVRAPLEKKLQENPGFLESLAAEVEALAAELAAADQGLAS